MAVKKRPIAAAPKDAYLLNIINSLNYSLYVVNRDYVITFANKAARERGAKEGCHCYKATHKRNTPCTDEVICPLKEVIKTKKSIITEHIHYDNKGNKIFVEIHGDPIFNERGEVVEMIECAIDIVKHKAVEMELALSAELNKKIIEISPFGIFIVNQAGVIEYANQAMIDISATPKEKMIGFNLITSPTYKKIGLDELIKKAIAEKKPFKTDIIKYESLFGKKETSRLFTGIPLLDTAGNFSKLLLTINDQTEMQNKNEELQKINELMVGRELKMIELKQEIARLKELLSKNANK